MRQYFTEGYWADFWEAHAQSIGAGALRVVVSIAVILVTLFIVRKIIDRVVYPLVARAAPGDERRREKQAETIRVLLRSIAGYVLAIAALLMILANVGVDIKALLAGVGIVGLALGFGAQQLVKDLIGGLFILFEDQYTVGDFVTIGAHSGCVEEIGLRFTRLRHEDGRRITISNGSVIAVVNHSRGEIEIRIKFAVAAPDGIDDVAAKMKAAEKGLPDGVSYFGVAEVTGARVTLEFRAKAPWRERERVESGLREQIAAHIQRAGLTLA